MNTISTKFFISFALINIKLSSVAKTTVIITSQNQMNTKKIYQAIIPIKYTIYQYTKQLCNKLSHICPITIRKII